MTFATFAQVNNYSKSSKWPDQLAAARDTPSSAVACGATGAGWANKRKHWYAIKLGFASQPLFYQCLLSPRHPLGHRVAA